MTLQSGRQGSSKSEGLHHSFARMFCVLCACSREPQAGLQNISADGWVSHFYHPGSTVCSVFPLKNVVPSRGRCISTHGTSEDKSLRTQQQSPEEASSPGRSQEQISGQHFPHAWTSFPFFLNLFNSLYTPSSLDRCMKRQTHASSGLNISLMKESFQPGSITDS